MQITSGCMFVKKRQVRLGWGVEVLICFFEVKKKLQQKNDVCSFWADFDHLHEDRTSSGATIETIIQRSISKVGLISVLPTNTALSAICGSIYGLSFHFLAI